MKERNHTYLYTVEVRAEDTWVEKQVEAYNIWQVIGKLKLTEKQVRYKHKEIL